MKKIDSHIFQGLQRDMSISKQQPQFLWEANNIRLTAREGDTLMSVTTEKGSKLTTLSGEFTGAKIIGNYVGHCVLGDYLTVFTHNNSGDYIFRIHKEGDGVFTLTCLTGKKYDTTGKVIAYSPLNLGFNTKHPLQTLGVYENKYIQKVYWTDGVNQPRVINIVKDSLSGKVTYTEDSFDFVPKMQLDDQLYVRKIADSSGTFGAGVIQYLVSYFNKYGQESNISCISPLIPTSYSSRAGNAEEKIGNSFEVTIVNPDTSFEYARIYSMFRSSINATPACKRVIDIKLSGSNSSNTTTEITVSNPVSYSSIDREYDFQVRETYAGEWKSQSSYQSKIQRTHVPGSNIDGYFYVFDKSEYPELTIKATVKTSATTQITKYITWGEASQLYFTDEAIYVNFQPDSMCSIFGNNGTSSADFIVADYIGTHQYTDEGIKFVDNGTIGDDIDSQELLYIGGESITAETIEQKDGTLFMGNVKINRNQITQDIKETLENQAGSSTSSSYRYAYLPMTIGGDNYRWGNSLNAKMAGQAGQYDSSGKYKDASPNISTAGFKSGEHYRLGVQFQYKTGKWSEPIFLTDKVQDNRPLLADRSTDFLLTIPTFITALGSDVCTQLVNAGYVRARGVIVLPTAQDRLITAQGMLCPSVYSIALQKNHTPDYQSSWFFRPWGSTTSIADLQNQEDTALYRTLINSGASVEYRHNHSLFGFNNRGAEIQGVPMNWGGQEYKEGGNLPYGDTTKEVILGYNSDGTIENNDTFRANVDVDKCNNIFCVDQQNVTMHSPDFEFDTSFASLDLTTIKLKKVGLVKFSANVGNIDIQTSSPCIGKSSTGFYHKVLSTTISNISDRRLCAGLFYWDYLVDEDGDTYEAYDKAKHEVSFMVYPWHKTGSLNNDVNRPTGGGTKSAVLQNKIISNLKFSNQTDYSAASGQLSLNGEATTGSSNAIQLFDSDQVQVVKTSNLNYYGNVDMILVPPTLYGCMFSAGTFSTASSLTSSGTTDFATPMYELWTGRVKSDTAGAVNKLVKLTDGSGNFSFDWNNTNTNIGDDDKSLCMSRESIRMKYKSTPHAAISLAGELYDPRMTVPTLYMAELYRDSLPSTDFGGQTDEAKQSNLWIPAGDAITIEKAGTTVHYDYGDTWYQRYDCLKTYPYTEDDTNSIVEIGSFMVESHVNLDGRYDRNRGQDDNTMMSPVNFNLINDVYSQTDNFFNYRILDSDYYDLSEFPAMLTWTTFKNNASDVDPWTTVTLASTLEIDGTRGEITDIVTFKDTLYAFQERGITQVLFNSRVAISTSDNVPIEISNNYKVDGNRYISTAVGCHDKFAVAKSPQGVYFIDSIGKALYLLAGDQLANVSDTHGFGYWFSQQDIDSKWLTGTWQVSNYWQGNTGVALYYDFNKKDLYVNTPVKTLCYSELLQQFITFLDYQGGILFNIGSTFHALTNKIGTSTTMDMWNMFEGEYCKLLYSRCQSDITFISNAESAQDKIFTNLDIRMDVYDENDELQHNKFFDTIRAWNEYQDTEEVALEHKYHPYNAPLVASNTKKKFRIWRCEIPRAKKNGKTSLDRMRNTWCKILLTLNKDKGNDPLHMEMHDVNVIYYN